MIIDPFTPPRLRVRSYYMYIATVALVIVLLYVIQYLFLISNFCYAEKLDGNLCLPPYLSVDFMVMAIVYVIALPSNFAFITLIICRLNRKGMSPNTMKSFRRRYLFIFLITVPFYFSSMAHEIYIHRHYLFRNSNDFDDI